ncbi:MAG: GNAT family N-acetyltransferase [Ilumatobacteraceae bacterium]
MRTDEIEGTRGYEEFVSAVAGEMGLGDAVHHPGTSVIPADDRSGSAMVVAYSISEHTVLWCDPALADDLFELADPLRATSQTEFISWAERVGWGEVSVDHMQLLRAAGVVRPDVSTSAWTRSLDRECAEDVALIDAFKALLSDADRDEADLDEDRLDEHMLAIVDDHGIAAFASQQPFALADTFGDIAVATRPDARGSGLGKLAVAALCDEIGSRSMWPLYRCDTANLGSVRLSASLGFVPVVRILACKRREVCSMK